MIIGLPLAVFLLGLAGAYLRGGWLRLIASILMLGGTAWSLIFVTDWRLGPAWMIGPMLGSLLLLRTGAAGRLSFEALTRRAITLAATVLVALFAASKFPIGENPTLLTAVPWLLAAVGAAWLISPLDGRERAQSLVLLTGAGAAILTAAAPVGAFTAAASGALAMVPAIACRSTLPGSADQAARALLLLAAAALAVLALLAGPLPRPALQDLAFSLDGPALLAAALLLTAGALTAAPGRTWILVPGLATVLAVAPSLRWAALAALVATGFDAEARQERVAWLALLLLALTTLFAAVNGQPWGPRAQTVGLAGTLVLMSIATGLRREPAFVLAVTAVAILQGTAAASAGLMVRFQWAAAAGAVLLVARLLLVNDPKARARQPLEGQLLLGLLLLAVAAHDALGLGALAAVLLIVDLISAPGVRSFASGPAGSPRRRRLGLVVGLARSGWPPTARFAGVTLAVIAALQTSLAWGLLAAALLVALKVTPLIETATHPAGAGSPRAMRRSLALLAPALSLACGLAPALVLRMLRV